ncbi:hypothetical protein ACS0TY_006165 [Phlomoides rotata]
MLMSELAHMRKLYNDIIYIVQNHVKPVTPSNSYHSSLFLTPPSAAVNDGSSKPLNHLLIGYNRQIETSQNPKRGNGFLGLFNMDSCSSSSPSKTAQSSVTILEQNESCRTKLFGVALSSKKRLHPYYNSSMEMNKTRLVIEWVIWGPHFGAFRWPLESGVGWNRSLESWGFRQSPRFFDRMCFFNFR